MTHWIDHTEALRQHIQSDVYFLTSISCSDSIASCYFMSLKYRKMMPRFKEIRSYRDFKCWLLGHLIRSIHFK